MVLWLLGTQGTDCSFDNVHAVINLMSFIYFQECTRKESEYSSNAVTFKEKYHSVCKQMGIKVRIKTYNSCQKSCFKVLFWLLLLLDPFEIN